MWCSLDKMLAQKVTVRNEEPCERELLARVYNSTFTVEKEILIYD